MGILSTPFLNSYRSRKVNWGFPSGPNYLGELVYRRTYRRGDEDWRSTLERVVEGAFELLEKHYRNNDLLWDDGFWRQHAEDMYERAFSFKFLPPGRGLWLMGTDFVRERGGAGLNNCLAAETELITRDGTKKIGECAGTKQTVLTKGGAWVEAPVSSFGKQRLYRIRLTRQGVSKDVFATAGHRWFASDRRKAYRDGGHAEFTTLELRPNVHRLQYVFGNGSKLTSPSAFGIAHGVVFGDGTTVSGDGNANYIVLCGEKNQELLRYFHGCPTSPAESGVRVGSIPNHFRERPALRENKSYLLGWLAGYFAADGSVSTDGQVTISSSRKEDLEFVRDVCYVLGIGTYSINEDDRVSNLTNERHIMYRMTLMRDTLNDEFFILRSHRERFSDNCEVSSRYWTVDSVEETDRFEEVFCATVDGYGAFALADNILTGNCAFVSTDTIDTDPTYAFEFLMDMSMLGVGVGFDTQGAGKICWKPSDEVGQLWLITDDREGFVKSTMDILRWGFGMGPRPRFLYHGIRKEGSPIKGFGGTASGPGPLIELHEDLVRLILRNAGKPISARDIVDIQNLIGVCVVAGNTRRTAEIAFGAPDDEEYLSLKDYAKYPERGAYGWTSNNSVFAHVGMNYGPCANRTRLNGEPGYAWLKNMQAYGRMSERPNWLDRRVKGGNPCLEQSLEDGEMCCLVENFIQHHESLADFKNTLRVSWLYAKIVTTVMTHRPKVNEIIRRNRRVGSSMSGVAQFLHSRGRDELLRWADEGYAFINECDHHLSRRLRINDSVKKTSIKPSGTVSLLAGATPGCHYPIRNTYIRRVRYAAGHPDLLALADAGYKIEPAIVGFEDYPANTKPVYDTKTVVVEFPVDAGENAPPTEWDVSLRDKVSVATDLQAYWADNQVSCTASFLPEEGDQIEGILKENETKLKGISFLPLQADMPYPQMPYESITRDDYARAVGRLRPIVWGAANSHTDEDKGCDGTACLIMAQ